jgi:MFS family permease
MNENTSRAGRREWIGLAVLTLPALLVTMDLSVLFRSLSLIRSLFPEEQRRTVAIGVWMSAFAAGAAVGPLVGGALLEQFWWGSVFLLNAALTGAILMGAAAAVAALVLRRHAARPSEECAPAAS